MGRGFSLGDRKGPDQRTGGGHNGKAKKFDFAGTRSVENQVELIERVLCISTKTTPRHGERVFVSFYRFAAINTHLFSAARLIPLLSSFRGKHLGSTSFK